MIATKIPPVHEPAMICLSMMDFQRGSNGHGRGRHSTHRISTKAIFDGTGHVHNLIAMERTEQTSEQYSDEELEEIMDMHAAKDMISAKEVREAIRENPLLMAGLVFAFGLLAGIALSPKRRR
jgi:hypothetical protein